MIATIGFAFLAGIFSTLSPCVLPLLPLVLGAAASEHRFGPVALAAGLAISFTSVGLFIATVGFAIGLDGETFRVAGAVLLVVIGMVLAVPRFQTAFATAAGPVGNWAQGRFAAPPSVGLLGQFGIGLLLGIVWGPCVGPTLGAASVLAARGSDLGQVAVTMVVFGIGAALPLLLLGRLSRETMMRLRGRLMSAGSAAKSALGAMLIVLGLVIAAGLDKRLETVLVDASPAWLTDLTTRF